MHDARPLVGVRVLDLTANLSGPFATMILADQGADIVKVEPPQGDIIRSVGTMLNGVSTYFVGANRGKRSICIDTTCPRGRELLDELLERADVLAVNFRSSAVERLHLSPDDVLRKHPRLVYLSIRGYGFQGPRAHAAAYDHVIQAASGLAATQADPKTGVPSLVRQAVVDKVTGLAAAQAVTAALFARERTGTGQHVAIAMLDAAIAFLWPDGMVNHSAMEEAQVRPPIANSFRLTKTMDGYVALAALTDDQWQGLFRAIGRHDLVDDERFATAGSRAVHGGEAMRVVAAALAELPTPECLRRLEASGVPCSTVVALDAIADDPQVRANGTIVERRHPHLGLIREAAPMASFDGAPRAPSRPAPLLGEHTDEILVEMGLGRDVIDRLRADRIVR